MAGNTAETVVFVHGLYMNGLELTLLRRRVEEAGFATRQFSYGSLRASVGANAIRLGKFVNGLPGETLHFVGHSLGGLVILRLFERAPVERPGRIVLLGSPVRGSRVARMLSEAPWGRWLLGQSGPDGLVEIRDAHWNGTRELGVIAGSGGFGLGQLVGELPEPHDGTVAVDETHLEGETDHCVLPTTHLGMLYRPDVARQVIHFLVHGRFDARECAR